jgi:hypothetical protein
MSEIFTKHNPLDAWNAATQRVAELKAYIRNLESTAGADADVQIARDELKANVQRANLLTRRLVANRQAALDRGSPFGEVRIGQ